MLEGVAVSLNALARTLGTAQDLPRMRILGFAIDPTHRDWVIWGEDNPKAQVLPVDALVIAFAAVRKHIDVPAVDIRVSGSDADQQAVTFSGGIDNSVVGHWFFTFDHWAKRRAVMGEPDVQGCRGLSYWERLLERERAFARAGQEREALRQTCRFWLSAGEFKAVEDDECLAFESTPLRVDVEEQDVQVAPRNPDATLAGLGAASLAKEFASDLTQQLGDLDAVHVADIAEFAKLMAGIRWLCQVDPYHLIGPWLEANPRFVPTPDHVSSLRRSAVLPAHNLGASASVLRLDLQGGVTIEPRLQRFSSADDSLDQLWAAVCGARPDSEALVWTFRWTRT